MTLIFRLKKKKKKNPWQTCNIKSFPVDSLGKNRCATLEIPLAAAHQTKYQKPQLHSESQNKIKREKMGGGGGHLYALDFDGVICDSCGESSLSALKVKFSTPRCLSFFFLF